MRAYLGHLLDDEIYLQGLSSIRKPTQKKITDGAYPSLINGAMNPNIMITIPTILTISH
jgi:hypothetical protein